MPSRWPEKLWIVRHGESMGNVANAKALAEKSHLIDILERDVDVALSPLGAEQAMALGDWFNHMPSEQRPQHIMSSPYSRARMTAERIAQQASLTGKLVIDERLREKELGTLDRLTRFGIEALFPDQAELKSRIGKFYYRPPGGESWCDVILRLRSALETICLHFAGKRLVIVAHQVVVMCFRYILEDMTEQLILEIDASGDVKNCSITEYRFSGDEARGLELVRYNYVVPLQIAGAPVTAEKSKHIK